MTITGPLTLPRYTPASTKAPTPSLTANPDWTLGQVLTCLQTGRVWVVGCADGTTTKQVRQVLPHVRKDDNTKATRIVNNNGEMKVTSEAGVLQASFNIFDGLRVDQDGTVTVGASGMMYGNSDGQMSFAGPQTYTVEDSSETLSTSSASPTVLYTVNQGAGGWVDVGEDGTYLIVTTRQFHHANAYSVTMAIERSPDGAGSTYYPLIYSQIDSGNGGGYRSLTLQAVAPFGPSYGTFRVRAYANTAGVNHVPYTGVNQWPSAPVSPNAGYQEQYRSNLFLIRVG